MEIEQNKTKRNQLLTIIGTIISTVGIYYFLLNSLYYHIISFVSILIILNVYLLIIKKRLKEYITSEILSALLTYSTMTIAFGNIFNLQFHIYVISLCIYHFSEYWSVLIYHYNKLKFSSFLIDQSNQWMIATTISFIELVIENFFLHKYKMKFCIIGLGIVMMITGHIFRIGALFTGKKNFTHLISYHKKKDHVLVKHGIYSLSRHPSYFGFYIWSVGTQVMCFNPICIIGFTIVLFFFFNERIQDEEEFLIQFFGPEYIDYKKKVPILIPCKYIY